MLLAPVDYYRPNTVEEALAALAGTEDARPLAGGQSLISLLKLRATSVGLLVDISRLETLRAIETGSDGSVRIGAGVTYAEMERSSKLAEAFPDICRIAAQTVDVQVRNRGTLGGNLCHNDPINNFPPLMVALDATMHILGAGENRDVPASEFFTGYFSTALEDDEILGSVSIPPLPEGFRVGYQEVEIGEAAARAVAVVRSSGSEIMDVRLVLGCLPVPTRRFDVEEALRGLPATKDAVAQATASAGEGIDTFSDADASEGYRREMASVVAKRAVMEALLDTGGIG